MPRPFKNRRITGFFSTDCYKPNGIPRAMLTEVELGVDELEALRLADLENLYQDIAAEKMGISRQTFGNIVKRARNKVADAIINGKVLRIVSQGFSYAEALRCCKSCGRIWRNPAAEPVPCPACGSGDWTIPNEAFGAAGFFRCGRKRMKGR
ncbi:MAG: DUF134 domain-containing protein [Victivallaceae bacterium]|nr:DUF134 domain-containing protein [Victivallaceae bacterium]